MKESDLTEAMKENPDPVQKADTLRTWKIITMLVTAIGVLWYALGSSNKDSSLELKREISVCAADKLRQDSICYEEKKLLRIEITRLNADNAYKDRQKDTMQIFIITTLQRRTSQLDVIQENQKTIYQNPIKLKTITKKIDTITNKINDIKNTQP